MTSDQCLLGHAYVACFHPPRRDSQTGLLWVDQLAQKRVNVHDVQVGSLPLPRMLLFPPSSLLEDLHSRPVMTWPWAKVPARSSKDLGVTNFAFVCRKCYLFVLFQKMFLTARDRPGCKSPEKSLFLDLCGQTMAPSTSWSCEHEKIRKETHGLIESKQKIDVRITSFPYDFFLRSLSGPIL